MIDTIKYNYDLYNLRLVIVNNKKYIKTANKLYQFIKIYNEEYIKAVYNISSKYEQYEKIILNRNKSIFTKYNEDIYILIEKKTNQEKFPQSIVVENLKNNILDTTNWDELWSKKIDYIEKKYKELKTLNKYIDESIYYYIGMAECAISYFKQNIKGIMKEKTICRRRMKEDDYYNPLNLVIDYKMRDIAEYLKEIFFINKHYTETKISLILKNAKDKNDCLLIYCRMHFPNYYFDEYMKLIKNHSCKVKTILERIDEYEIYVNKIYKILKKKYGSLEKIEWTKKEQY